MRNEELEMRNEKRDKGKGEKMRNEQLEMRNGKKANCDNTYQITAQEGSR
jgi:hypothetical protein